MVRRLALPLIACGVLLTACGGGHSHAASTGAGATGGGSGFTPAVNAGQTGSLGGSGSTSGTGGGSGGSSTGSASGTAGSVPGVYGFPVGPLLPTSVDAGQCQAAQFADKSVYAQIAIDRATCAQVPSVAAGADRARGTSYSAAGFACVAAAQQPSNGYWISAYFSYNCRNGDDQIAFNWGTSSSRF